MPDNTLGVHLTLLVGPTVPLPASAWIADAIERVEVRHDDAQRSGFQITFRATRGGVLGALDYPIAADPSLRPFNRVILVVTFDAMPYVLMDGIITQHQLSPATGGAGGTLTVTGEDVSVMMDLEEKSTEHPAQDDSVIALKIIGTYAQYGLVPMVIPPPMLDPPLPIERVPVQQATDLGYLKEMAARHGYVFYVVPGPAPSSNLAYWGPPIRVGIVQRALSIDMGRETNVRSFDVQSSALASTFVEGKVQDRTTNQSTSIQTFGALRIPLSSQPAWMVNQPNVRKQQLRQPGLTIAQAFARAQAMTDASTDAVTVSGELDALRYASLLQARALVGVRGAGYTHDGFYYVQQVTHQLSRGAYAQRFVLKREGTGALSPVVPA